MTPQVKNKLELGWERYLALTLAVAFTAQSERFRPDYYRTRTRVPYLRPVPGRAPGHQTEVFVRWPGLRFETAQP